MIPFYFHVKRIKRDVYFLARLKLDNRLYNYSESFQFFFKSRLKSYFEIMDYFRKFLCKLYCGLSYLRIYFRDPLLVGFKTYLTKNNKNLRFVNGFAWIVNSVAQ